MRAIAKLSANFVSREEAAARFKGKRVAVVGSGPSCLKNKGAEIDAHDIVVRINNYKTRRFEKLVGRRTDVHYSFYGNSIKKPAAELMADGVTLCMCKCPDGRPIESPWHTGAREIGIDFRWIYQKRQHWWFCDTYVPTVEAFLAPFEALGRRMPTTGFACLFELLTYDCELYVTGFDFFHSGVHNVNERWRRGPANDPIAHAPERERKWLAGYIKQHPDRLRVDATLKALLT